MSTLRPFRGRSTPLRTARTGSPVGANSLGDSPVAMSTDRLMASRQNTSPRRLVAPGPDRDQLQQILRAAASAPDHGLLRPWRLVLVPTDKRDLLAEVFAQALLERDPGAAPEQIEMAREKAHRAPVLLLVVARLGHTDPHIPLLERMVSVGAAVQNMLLMAHAQGFGSGLTSGQAMRSAPMRAAFDLDAAEEAVCFVNLGTVSRHKAFRQRPDPAVFFSSL